MIIVKLMGGLGNQMFQYAAGRRLAHVNNTNLKLDLSWYTSISESETYRQYELHHFAIKEDIASAQEVARLRKARDISFRTIARGLTALINPFYRPTHIVEKHYHFDPDILKLQGEVYLDGYWQSEKYFADIKETILKAFTIRNDPDILNRQVMETVMSNNTVSVHMRRGDYVSCPSVRAYHGPCSLTYYAAAVEKIASLVSNPHFFVFSDNPLWARESLKIPHPVTFLDHNGPDKGHEDMRLMSLCRHHIIANSSFSWWGAWLCRNPIKIVIAPHQWFEKKDLKPDDLLPKEWIKL